MLLQWKSRDVILITISCVWHNGEGFFVEDLSKDQKAFQSLSMVSWIESRLLDMLLHLIYIFFSEKLEAEDGIICLSKFRSLRGWFVECAIWPSGGRKNIHVLVGSEK